MTRYILTTKDKKEVINSYYTHSLILAITYFAAVKQISESDLLKIYDVLKQS